MIRIVKLTPANAWKQREAARRRRNAARLRAIGDVDDYDAFDFYEAFIADAGDR